MAGSSAVRAETRAGQLRGQVAQDANGAVLVVRSRQRPHVRQFIQCEERLEVGGDHIEVEVIGGEALGGAEGERHQPRAGTGSGGAVCERRSCAARLPPAHVGALFVGTVDERVRHAVAGVGGEHRRQRQRRRQRLGAHRAGWVGAQRAGGLADRADQRFCVGELIGIRPRQASGT